MRSLRLHAIGLLVSLVAITSCSSPMTHDGSSGDATNDMVQGDGPRDVTRTDVPSGMCAVDDDCNDMVFCNGVERCAPGASNADERGCVLAMPQNPCLTGQRCNESMMRCDAICSQALDADGDGHRAMACGGDDCDDADPNRFPGNPEVCDSMGHDEDCDANSFGLRDTDMDGFVDHTCCNTDSASMQHCGDDCNDSRPNQHPALAETCDGIDNNCDGTIDEGVEITFYPDNDGDTYGDSMAPVAMQMHGCVAPMGYAASHNDCDDHSSDVHPGALEQCDAAMVDENCDGISNPTMLCACNGDITRPCATATGQCSSGTERCVNGSWGLCSIGPTPEICNGLDDDCDGMTDETLSVTCYPDGDNDGYPDAGAMPNTVCPVPGRDGFAGCPPNQTNRAPTGVNIDCNDANSTISPGQPELCDPGMVDENCDGLINPASLCMCTEGQTRPCMATGTCGAGNQTCSGGRFSSCSVNPVAESCNAIDDDCDGMIDEGLTITCYPDNDNDGFAPMGATSISSCPVMGRAYVGGCPTGQTNVAPVAGSGTTRTTIDCNDTNATINPSATETCDSAMVDEDCDGTANPSTLCACSGTAMRACPLSGVCAAGSQTCSGGSWGSCSISPLAESCNALDDDCDGMTDEGLTVQCYPDADNDGFAAMSATASSRCPVSGREAFGGCPTATTNRVPMGATNTDCNDAVAAINPAAPEVCDAAMADENCDGTANPSTLCMCSGSATRMCTLPGACAAGSQSCTSGAWGACSIGPVSESCNGIDDNCNGMTDEGLTITCYADADNDGYAATGTTAVQSCAATGRTAVGGCPTNQTNRAPTTGNVDCNDSNASVNPGATEQCDTAMLDENCDGTANPMSLCACTGTATRSCSMAGLSGPCAAGTQTCASGSWGTCSIQPVTETCNGTDDDCDGTVDEGLTVTCYADPDNDGFAAMSAASSPQCAAAGREFVGGCPVGYTNRAGTSPNVDCAPTDPSRYPSATERCNAVDEDCDGMIDEGVALTFYRDADGDGFGTTSATMTSMGCTPPAGYVSSNTDCNDSSTAIHPGAPETCNGVDDDCNGMTDEGVMRTFYRDADGDGYGLLSSPTTMASCTAPAGYVADSSDCNDTCNACHPGGFELCDGIDNNCTGGIDEGATITCYTDGDNDFYPPMGATSISTCAVVGRDLAGGCPTGRTYRTPTSGNIDCNDSAATVNPGATEVCDGAMVDENCDGMANPSSLCTCSGSGTRACPLPGACAAGTQTCTAGAWSACTVTATTEVCDGVDNDCDGMTDENGSGGSLAISCYLDNDSDGYGRGSSVARCADSTRMTAPFNGCPAGYTANATDCNDANSGVSPGATESCNGVDDDCDGMTDEALTVACYVDADNDRYGTGTATTQCRDGSSARMPYGYCPVGYSATALDCGDTNASVNPMGTESCNGIDDNCNGMIDEALTTNCYVDADNDTYGVGVTSTRQCTDSSMARMPYGGCPIGYSNRNGDCADMNAAAKPTATEVCNGIDDDCDGMTDEGVLTTYYADADGDGFGASSGMTRQACSPPIGFVANNTDCNDSCVSCYPGGTEACDGRDNNCNSMTDEGVTGTYYPDGDGDGYGRMGTMGIVGCSQPIGYAPNNIDCDDTNNQKAPGLGEACDGLDNNCNGTVDDQAQTDLLCAASSGSGGTAVCRSGSCRLISCTIGLADCDGTRSNGCEVDIRIDANNCGACGVTCGGGQCVNGRCDRPTTVSAGKYHTCATRGTGEVSCWGNNSDYQLGDGSNFDRDTPVAVQNITANAVQVVGGDRSTCARMANGTVFCWGANFEGEVGNGMTGGDTSMSIGARWATPQQVRGASGTMAMYLSDATMLAAGGSHICALRSGGTVVCWGDNQASQLGDGMSTHTDCSGVAGWQDCSTIPLTVPGLSGVTKIAAGSQHTCAIISGGGVRCWGANTYGQLGDGTTTTGTMPVTVSGGFIAVELAAYEGGTCARLMSGAVRCWGRNNQGQIGDGTTTDRPTATAVMLPATDAVEIDADAGGNHVCVRRTGGTIMCWGRGIDGQLGYSDTPVNQSTPVTVRNISNATSLGIGGWHSCAFLNDGRLQCWGLNSDGQIGDGTPVQRNAPSTTINLVNLSIVQESAGGHHTCARRASGAVGCWGDNTYGQLGDGTNTDALSVVQTAGQAVYIDVSSGLSHTCGVRQIGTVFCWGRNQLGQLGDGTTTDHNTPTQAMTVANAWRVATGSGHSCALLTTGAVMCWGDNTYGQLGDNTTTARPAPVSVVGLTDAVDIEAGARHTCARRSTGLVVCWGQGSGGRIGDGAGAQRNAPATVSGLDDAVAIELGEQHTCALRVGGTASCWGTNFYGQLGDNTAVDRLTPVAVSGLANATAIAAGRDTSCALRGNGTIACWGHNTTGAVGDGSTSNRPTPANTFGINTAQSITVGGDVSGTAPIAHSCAHLANSTIMCWGVNNDGELGDGTTSQRLTPVTVLNLP